MRSLLVLISLTLSGCWIGGPFYQASDARAAVPPGEYRFLSSEEQGPMRISVGDDGYTTLVPLGEDGTAVQRDAVTVGLSPLPGSDRAFVIWFPQGIGSDISPAESSYGLLLRAEQEYRIAFPNCESDEQIATAAGAEVEGETIRLCRFRSRAQLEETFGRYAASASVMFRLVRRGGG